MTTDRIGLAIAVALMLLLLLWHTRPWRKW